MEGGEQEEGGREEKGTEEGREEGTIRNLKGEVCPRDSWHVLGFFVLFSS